MAVAASLNVLLTANAAQYETTMNRAARTAATTGKEMTQAADAAEKSGAGFGRALKYFSATAGAALSIEGLRRMTLGVLDTFENTTNLADRVGATYNELSALQQAAKENGSSADVMNTALEKMTAVLGDAKAGSTSATAALQRLGLSIEQLDGLSGGQQFALIAEKINALPTPMERASAQQDIFGKGAKELAKTLKLTGQELDAYYQFFERNGISQAQQEQLAAAKTSVENLTFAWDRLKTSVVAGVAPVLSRELNALAAGIDSINGIKPANLATDTYDRYYDGAGQMVIKNTRTNEFVSPDEFAAISQEKEANLRKYVEEQNFKSEQAARAAAGKRIDSFGFTAIDDFFSKLTASVERGANTAATAIVSGAAVASLNSAMRDGGITFRAVIANLSREAGQQFERMQFTPVSASPSISAGSFADRMATLQRQARSQSANNPVQNLVKVQQSALGLLSDISATLKKPIAAFDL